MKLTQEQKRVKIAEFCSWTWHPAFGNAEDYTLEQKAVAIMCWAPPGAPSWNLRELPEYFSDRNAMHAAKKSLTFEQCRDFHELLLAAEKPSVVECRTGRRAWSERWTWDQPPEVEAECFGLAVKLWDSNGECSHPDKAQPPLAQPEKAENLWDHNGP